MRHFSPLTPYLALSSAKCAEGLVYGIAIRAGAAAMFWTREVARDVPGRKRAVQPICSRIGRRGSRPSCATQSRVALRNRSLAFDAWPHDWEARACLPSSW